MKDPRDPRGSAGSVEGPGDEGLAERRELEGVTVVITRSEEKTEELRRALEGRGARVVAIPTIRHAPATDIEAFRRAAEGRTAFACVALTSQTTVRFFLDATRRCGLPASVWREIRLAAVGPKTAAALREAGLEPSLVADGGGARLARALLEGGWLRPGSRVLFPRSSRARPELAEALERAGVAVEPLTLYETIDEDPSRAEPLLSEAMEPGGPAAILFASPSAFGSFVEIAGERGRKALSEGALRIVTIGPTTSAAVRERGFSVAWEAEAASVEGMVRAALELFSS